MSRVPTETRSRILQAARSLFSSHGFASTSLDDILNVAGITKGAFYHYFSSKQQLCVLILEDVIAEYQTLTTSINPDLSPEAQLRQWLTILSEKNASGQWVNCRLISRLSVQMQQLGPDLQSRLINFWKWYEGFCRNLFVGCGLNTQQAATASRMLLCMLFGSIWLEKTNPSSVSILELTEFLVQSILKKSP